MQRLIYYPLHLGHACGGNPVKTYLRVDCAGSPRKGDPQGGLAGLDGESRQEQKSLKASKQANALGCIHRQSIPGPALDAPASTAS